MLLFVVAVFDGFENTDASLMQIATALGGTVALECDFLDAMPVPTIEWFMNNETTAIAESGTAIIYADNGRYLFIGALTLEQRDVEFHCEVTNALLGSPVRAPTRYSLSNDIAADALVTYGQLEPYTAELDSTLNVQYAAAYRLSGSDTGMVLSLVCTPVPPVSYLGNALAGTISGLDTPGDVEVPCSIGSLGDITFEVQVTGTVQHDK